MKEEIRAVIFDMDGVLIDSERLWRQAMMKGFAEEGMRISDEECRQTMGLRFTEVVRLWMDRFGKSGHPAQIEGRVTGLLVSLIENEGGFINGIPEILDFCEAASLPMGLATSSSVRLMHCVTRKLGITSRLAAVVSAEKMKYGKPHPEVFLECAARLGVDPQACLVIEDSLNGVIAAKAARMKVIAVPDEGYRAWQQFAVADYRADDMAGALGIIMDLVGNVKATGI